MKDLPSACSLNETEMAAQRARYAVVARHVTGLAHGDRALRARLDGTLDAAVLRELIEVETACCPFFDISYDPLERLLSVSVTDEEHEPALQAIAHSLTAD
jgi:hypothetical protein